MLLSANIINKFSLLIVLIMISNFCFSQVEEQDTSEFKYFDENYLEISKEDFQNKRWSKRLLNIEGDSVHHRLLSVREENGRLQSRKYLDSLLNTVSKNKIDPSKPLVIIYYPGKDACNSGGTATRASYKRSFNKMEMGINKVKESNIIYVYNEIEGLKSKDGYKDWIKDPNQILKNFFFKRHYPCRSFVFISEQNYFISYFGEFAKEDVIKAVELLVNYKPNIESEK